MRKCEDVKMSELIKKSCFKKCWNKRNI